MTHRPPTSSVAALVMARTMKLMAEKYPSDDPELVANAVELERRALDAIRQHLPLLPEAEKNPAE